MALSVLQIVEGFREGGKVRHKVITNLGRIEQLQEGAIDYLIGHLNKFSKENWRKANPENLRVQWTKQWGPALVLHHLWNELSMGPQLQVFLNETEIVSPRIRLYWSTRIFGK